MRRCTRPGSSPTGSSARRSARSTRRSSPAASPTSGSTNCANSGRGFRTTSLIPGGLPTWMASAARNMLAVTNGVPAFFNPNPMAFLSPHNKLGADAAGYYSVEPLRRTLERAHRLRSAQSWRHPANGRRVARAQRGDALFRLARHAACTRSRHGLRRASAGLPRGADRRRALLGRRHPFEHAGRSRVRRQPASRAAWFSRSTSGTRMGRSRRPSGRS